MQQLNCYTVIEFAYFEEVEYHYILYQLRFVREGVETKSGYEDTCAAKSIKYTIDYTILILACWPFGLNGLEMKIFEIKIII